MSTIQQLLDIGKEKLMMSGNEYAKYDRKVLLEDVLGCNYMYMLTHGEEMVSPEKEQRYLELIERRSGHYPLQYLLGYANFMDYRFYVNEDVLIPRNDTEVLVEQVDEYLKDKEKQGIQTLHLMDLCCGSGCIGISLKLYHPEMKLTLSDVSEKALKVTRKNLEQYQIQADTHCGDLLDGITDRYDVIVSNPPYIKQQIIPTLMPEVKDHEPMLALDGGEDGLLFYRVIIGQAASCLSENGALFFEIGCDQGQAVRKLMVQNGFCDVQVQKDYAGLDRVVYGHL